MTKVLVTGGAGFIGSHLVERLCRFGYSVTVLDNLSQGKREWVDPAATLIEGDVLDLELVRRLMRDKDGVFHLAAMSRVLPSIGAGSASTLFSAEQNIMGTLNVLVAAEENGVGKVVYSASSTFYGNNPAPHNEDDKPGCTTPYAISKYAAEQYAIQFDRMYGLPVVCLRYFQVYGPHCPSSGPYAMVTSIFIEQAKKQQPLTIHGDGQQRRDFVHVRDVAKANQLAFEQGVHGVVINVGTGKSHSIKELADMVSDYQVNLPPRAFDMRETRADTTLCRLELGWVPEIDFKSGTETLIKQEMAK